MLIILQHLLSNHPGEDDAFILMAECPSIFDKLPQ